jgi:NAD(P)-binding Rossmann-like domain
MSQSRAIIIGAGPAGLTAAYELLTRTEIKPIVLEKSTCMGGISRTVNYKGNRIDIGGHRFFSKSDRVVEWWLRMLPLQASDDGPVAIKIPPHGARAVPGDTIVLDAGVTYGGNFTLSAKANPNGKWIYIVSSPLSSLPTPGNRVSPADTANMPKVVSTNVNAPLTFAQGANHYRLGGLEIYSTSTQGCNPNTTPPTSCFGYTLVDSKTAIGHPLVDSITIDRYYIHGSTTIDVQRGVSLNGSNYGFPSEVLQTHRTDDTHLL